MMRKNMSNFVNKIITSNINLDIETAFFDKNAINASDGSSAERSITAL
jgi:hypothetical protein